MLVEPTVLWLGLLADTNTDPVQKQAPASVSVSVSVRSEGYFQSTSADNTPYIYGGEASPSCSWEATAYLSYAEWLCTGTLVHPEIIMTAAHCADSETGRSVNVQFGEKPGEGGSVKATCYSYPPWLVHKRVGPDDFGYCKLDKAIDSIAPVPIAMGCEMDQWVRSNREIYLVGFGQSDNGGTGTKRHVKTVISDVGDTNANVGETGKGACLGDSGGPAYIRLPQGGNGQGSWRVFGITSGGPDPCGSAPAIYVLQNHAVPWVEEHSGIDITSCHQADGTWDPTESCHAFPLAINQSRGKWSTGCDETEQTKWVNTCGEPFKPENPDPDTRPPSIEWIHPEQGTMFSSEAGLAEVSFSVLADDGDGSGVDTVSLIFRDKVLEASQLPFAPFDWKVKLKPGIHEIAVQAIDRAGNKGTSKTIVIGVDEVVPEPSTSSESSSETDSEGILDDTVQSKGGCTVSRPPARGFGDRDFFTLGFVAFGFLAPRLSVLRKRRRLLGPPT